MSQCCGQQGGFRRKFGADECFSCLGNSVALFVESGHVYPSCSPLVQGETKNDPLKPMETPDECIVAWVGPFCDIDTTGWEEACKTHVYPCAKVYKERAHWPEDETGKCIFTKEDIEFIAQGHPGCCVGFDELQSCQGPREWLQEIQANNEGGKVA